MSMADTVQRYFDAWNAYDAEAIAATFAKGGTYEDPTTAGPLAGDAIGTNAAGLWAAFPDVSFEITSHVVAGEDLFAAQWTMRGTNSGSFAGLPPTGRTIAVKGADFIRVGNDGIRSVEGYFSPGEVPTQIGMQVIVQPDQVGPFTFGVSTRVGSEKRGAPGAFSITSLHASSDEEITHIRELSRQIAMEMRELEGFMGWVGSVLGDRMVTVTAWEAPEQAKQVMRLASHKEGTRGFFGTELAKGGWVSVWTSDHIGPVWARCEACGAMSDTGAEGGACACGAPLPEPRSHW